MRHFGHLGAGEALSLSQRFGNYWKSLKGEMATHSRMLPWRMPRTEEPGGLQSKGSQRAGHDWAHTYDTVCLFYLVPFLKSLSFLRYTQIFLSAAVWWFRKSLKYNRQNVAVGTLTKQEVSNVENWRSRILGRWEVIIFIFLPICLKFLKYKICPNSWL